MVHKFIGHARAIIGDGYEWLKEVQKCIFPEVMPGTASLTPC